MDYAAELKEITPPDTFADKHAELIEAVENFATAYTAFVDEATEETTKASQEAAAAMEEAIKPYLAEEAPAAS